MNAFHLRLALLAGAGALAATARCQIPVTGRIELTTFMVADDTDPFAAGEIVFQAVGTIEGVACNGWSWSPADSGVPVAPPAPFLLASCCVNCTAPCDFAYSVSIWDEDTGGVFGLFDGGDDWISVVPVVAGPPCAGSQLVVAGLPGGGFAHFLCSCTPKSAAQTFGTAYQGYPDVPAIDFRGAGPYVGNTRFQVVATNVPAEAQAAFLVIGFSNTHWAGGPLPFRLDPLGAHGGVLMVSLDAVRNARLVPTESRQGGDPPPRAGPPWMAVANLPIPPDPGLRGAQVYCQFLFHAPRANPLGLIHSDGLAIRVQ
jgi:hypothetical protein